MLYLTQEFETLWADRDPFEEVEKLEGEVFRALEARKTLRFEINGRGYFCKIHRGVGWREIIKNLLLFRLPVLGAGNEWQALNLLRELGVDTMKPVAFGIRGWLPATQRSFIITEELAPTESLEDFCRDWPSSPPPVRLKRALIERLAWMSRRMHENGINHRDYYICHFLLDLSGGREQLDAERIKVSLIDLHRAQLRDTVPQRWLVKDVGGLWFSAMDIGLTRRDLLRFVRSYRGLPLRESLQQDAGFWRAVRERGVALYRKQFGRDPVLPAGLDD